MADSTFARMLKPFGENDNSGLKLEDNSKVAVIGGGPAGSFFSIFFLDMVDRLGMDIVVNIYEPRDFSKSGPAGCNMCGGIISESLVQILATDGINLPPTIVQRGIDSYVLHTDVGSVKIKTPLDEKRIGAVHRGSGPKDIKEIKWGSFDGHLQNLAIEMGANVIRERVTDVQWTSVGPQIITKGNEPKPYDLLVVSVGVNSSALKIFQEIDDISYQAPQTTKSFIREYFLGEEIIEKQLGSSMHVFLLDLPRLEFAAVVPKGDYVSLCLLGDEIDKELIESFLNAPELKNIFPPDFSFQKGSCQCSPRISLKGATQPFADRLVFIGDSGVTRLYKDGIGAAYRTAKAAASTVAFHGISNEDFAKHYWPACQRIRTDNRIGKMVFFITRQIQRRRFTRKALLRMVSAEQKTEGSPRRMSTVLWDTFTGSARYQDIFLRALHPIFLSRFILDNLISIFQFWK